MRQIQMVVRFVARAVFRKDTAEYEIIDPSQQSGTDLIHAELLGLLAQNKFCEAEDYLFEHHEPDSEEHVRVAVDFYRRLGELDDETLEANNFPRDEIDKGLQDILKRSNIELL
jgi:hypothetical protein